VQVNKSLAALVERQSIYNVEHNNVVKRLRRSRQRADSVSKGAVSNISVE
jgi:hypothetical protein